MAIGVDTSKWKPRKIVGTPAAKFRNALAAGILGFGILWGAFFQLSNFTDPMKKAAEVLYEDPIEEVERKIMIASGMHVRSGDKLRQLMEEEKRIDLPDK
ncbi:hypothetical protein MSG28_012703 [Choristoneura fumiferana]|uniref:Uncharacterized protein n=1 Tax=Choristoneura fumiferana TaxID=7141 RepID=A0ACC0JHS8_CHOFU|nr:hypothetical protein MSG28_012703 [Choristoneura fumiferana]